VVTGSVITGVWDYRWKYWSSSFQCLQYCISGLCNTWLYLAVKNNSNYNFEFDLWLK